MSGDEDEFEEIVPDPEPPVETIVPDEEPELEVIEPDPDPFEPIEADPEPDEADLPRDQAGVQSYGDTPDQTEASGG